jgi:hypothetical protein
VLGCLDAERAPFSQGARVAYRERLMVELDRRLLERTAQVARASGAFDARKLPKTVRIAVNARLLEGAGRVGDTICWQICSLGRPSRRTPRPCARHGRESSTGSPPSCEARAGLQWTDASERAIALDLRVKQLDTLQAWIRAARRSGPPSAAPCRDARSIVGICRERARGRSAGGGWHRAVGRIERFTLSEAVALASAHCDPCPVPVPAALRVGPHGEHPGQRTAAAADAQAASYRRRASAPAPASRCGAPPCALGSPSGASRPLPRRTREPLRPATHRGPAEPRGLAAADRRHRTAP